MEVKQRRNLITVSPLREQLSNLRSWTWYRRGGAAQKDPSQTLEIRTLETEGGVKNGKKRSRSIPYLNILPGYAAEMVFGCLRE